MFKISQQINKIFKFLCILFLIIFLPQIISDKETKDNQSPKQVVKTEKLTGLKNLLKNSEKYPELKKLNMALVCSSIKETDNDKKRNIDLLIENKYKIKKIFVYEKNSPISDYKTKTPVVHITKLSNNILKNIDALVFDMQYSGISWDKPFKTLLKTMEQASNNNKKLIVLDRPNPLGGMIEGPGQIPYRNGLTIGEMAQYVKNYHLKKPLNLCVIPMVGFNRTDNISDFSDKNIPIKFNKSKECYTYSFLKILNKLDPIDIGKNSEAQYQALLFPKSYNLTKWELDHLKKICNQQGLSCKEFSYFNKNKNIEYSGLRLKLNEDVNKFSAFNTALNLARFLKNRKNLNICYTSKFDSLLKTSSTKDFLQSKISIEEYKNNLENNLHNFYSKSKNCALYSPLPMVNTIQLIRS